MEKAQFDSLNDGRHSRVPVWRTVLADLDTPLSVYLKLADGSDSYLFESVEGGETWGRYSIIGLPCRRLEEHDWASLVTGTAAGTSPSLDLREPRHEAAILVHSR